MPEDCEEHLRIAVAFAAEVSTRLDAALADRSVADVAREADVARSTVYDLRSGATWPDLLSVIKLELALDTILWVRPPR